VQDEDVAARVLGEIADGDVLPVAAEIGEAKRALVDHLQEARRAAAVLDVGLSIGVGRGEEERVDGFQECREIVGDLRPPRPLALHALHPRP
jgi:hypothetical protein